MPRGAGPGERRGGRAKGTPNKATIEREIIAEQVVKRARMEGKKLAKEILDDFMTVFAGMAIHYQPGGNPLADEAKFENYASSLSDSTCIKSPTH